MDAGAAAADQFTAWADDLTVWVNPYAADEVNDAAIEVAELASRWPITQVSVDPGYGHRPDALRVAVLSDRIGPAKRAVEQVTVGLDADVSINPDLMP